MRLADRFEWGARTYVMGIVNVTPDSFSGDGLHPPRRNAAQRGR
jgi:dihydropteroate synthase